MLLAVVFGVVDSVIKGNGGGIRSAIGNMSAPWLLLPFAAATIAGSRRVLHGAWIGLVVSVVALASFYFANTVVLQLGPHPWLVDLGLTVEGGKRFFVLALITGPVFGGLGAWWTNSRSLFAPLLVAALFVLEPGVAVLYGAPGTGIVWLAEILVGLLGALLVIGLSRRPNIN